MTATLDQQELAARIFAPEQRFCRVLEIPRHLDPDRAERAPDPTAAHLLAALVSAHTGGGTVTVAWVRPHPHEPVQVLLGGDPALGIEPVAGEVRPLYPPGSRGVPLSADNARQLLDRLPFWVRCGGVHDALAVADPDDPARLVRGTFEDYVAHLARAPFAWLVIAEPVPPQSLQVTMEQLAAQVTHLRDRQESFEAARVELERQEGRYRELARAETSGLWRVHVLAGGAQGDEVERSAALLCNASDLSHLPYTLRPVNDPADLDRALASGAQGAAARSPFEATSELLASIARPPTDEIPGVRLVTPNTFDVTPEAAGDIPLGTILDQALGPAGPFTVSRPSLNRHMFVCGATGAGKSQTVRALLERLSDLALPWLVIEPAKAEYARMAGRLQGRADVLVIRPGEADTVPVSINPLEPEPGFPLQTHIDLLRALFLAAFEAHEPFPQVLSYALTRCYEDLGWDLALSRPKPNRAGVLPKYPTLGDLQRTAKEVVDHIGYGKEVTADVRGFIDVRLGSLRLGTPGRFFEGGHPVDIGELLGRNVVLELEDIGNDQDKAFFIGTVLIRIVEYLRQHYGRREEPVELRHVTVVEEAHRLLKVVERDSPAGHAVELFAGLLAEIRAYGEGIVVAEQIPSKISPDVIKNTALKVVHRLPAHDDRRAVGATMNLDDRQSEYLVTLPPGRAAVFADGMDRPLLVAMPLGEDRETARNATRAVAVARRRSAACGTDCQVRPCTLEEMSEARHLADDPRLLLWLELLTVAHLVGEAEPQPDTAWLEQLRLRADQRTLECAVGQRAQAAVDARYAGLANHYQPEALAAHVAARATAWLAGDRRRCNGSEVEWQAGRFRWLDVLRALRDPALVQDAQHPSTPAWHERGLTLGGRTIAEQRAELERHPSTWKPSPIVVRGGDPPLVEAAAAQLSNLPEAIDRLTDAIRFLWTDGDWPELRLYPAAWTRRTQPLGATNSGENPGKEGPHG
jgi:DNA helicase HerA-like ATPase